ncbi:MAG TPA: hypothetical protein VMP11_04820 [Verrucomicrobiae bacterium]|nr:hypothetical protein [Verrucomicrobiae bacterium]
MYRQRIGLRAEYRDQEGERVKASPSLAAKFQKLKSLKVTLGYCNPKGESQNGELKYVVNLEHAKSVFRFRCPNDECIRGDFDLTRELASAVAEKRTDVTGELSCQGWQSKATVDTVHCHNILRYKLKLGY